MAEIDMTSLFICQNVPNEFIHAYKAMSSMFLHCERKKTILDSKFW